MRERDLVIQREGLVGRGIVPGALVPLLRSPPPRASHKQPRRHGNHRDQDTAAQHRTWQAVITHSECHSVIE